MATAELSGHRVIECRVQLPAWGVWWADVVTDDSAALSGAVSLKLADLTLEGTVVSGGPWEGRSHYRICAGRGGWGRPIPAKGWANDAGVKRATVLADAAAAAGEVLEGIPAGTVGTAWERLTGPASLSLQLLHPEAWHVGVDGVTRIGLRSAVPYQGKATRLPSDPALGKLELAADAVAELVPGVVVDGMEAVDVVHRLSAKEGLRTTLWCRAGRPSALAAMLSQLDPRSKYRGIFSYRVVTQEGERLNLQPERVSSGVPDLRRVRVRPGLPGCKAAVPLGSLVLVAFVDADPGRPVVVGFDDAESPGFDPAALYLEPGGVGRARVARVPSAQIRRPRSPVRDTIRLPPPVNAVMF